MSPRRSPRGRLAPMAAGLALALAGLSLGGCGFGPGAAISERVDIRVTTDFGGTSVGEHSLAKVPSAWTVMDLSRHLFRLRTSDGGGYVDAINGRQDASARRLDWFYYVNGIEAPKGASSTPLAPGDHVWWDLHDWEATQNVPAVVGSYPEPFTNGSGGKAFPTVLSCAAGLDRACTAVTRSLDRAGVKVAFQGLGTGSGSDSLAVLVGTFVQLRGTLAAELLQGGPSQSGVYAQFLGARGASLELENPLGDQARSARGSVGLIAAVQQPGLNEPVWLVTGTDRAGVTAAAGALTQSRLADHFAVVVLPGGRTVALPLTSSS